LRRKRVCRTHASCPSILLKGQQQRYCQQCGRFHPVKAFEDSRRSCRAGLAKHNARRSCRAGVARQTAGRGRGSSGGSWRDPAGSSEQGGEDEEEEDDDMLEQELRNYNLLDRRSAGSPSTPPPAKRTSVGRLELSDVEMSAAAVAAAAGEGAETDWTPSGGLLAQIGSGAWQMGADAWQHQPDSLAILSQPHQSQPMLNMQLQQLPPMHMQQLQQSPTAQASMLYPEQQLLQEAQQMAQARLIHQSSSVHQHMHQAVPEDQLQIQMLQKQIEILQEQLVRKRLQHCSPRAPAQPTQFHVQQQQQQQQQQHRQDPLLLRQSSAGMVLPPQSNLVGSASSFVSHESEPLSSATDPHTTHLHRLLRHDLQQAIECSCSSCAGVLRMLNPAQRLAFVDDIAAALLGSLQGQYALPAGAFGAERRGISGNARPECSVAEIPGTQVMSGYQGGDSMLSPPSSLAIPLQQQQQQQQQQRAMMASPTASGAAMQQPWGQQSPGMQLVVGSGNSQQPQQQPNHRQLEAGLIPEIELDAIVDSLMASYSAFESNESPAADRGAAGPPCSHAREGSGSGRAPPEALLHELCEMTDLLGGPAVSYSTPGMHNTCTGPLQGQAAAGDAGSQMQHMQMQQQPDGMPPMRSGPGLFARLFGEIGEFGAHQSSVLVAAVLL